jgi:hypothetical protein
VPSSSAAAGAVPAGGAVPLTWPQALHWRLRRQLVDPPGTLDPEDVVTRLTGVQAQVPAAADLAVAVRTAGRSTGLSAPLADGRLVRTWAARGTLHVLPVAAAARQLSLLAAARTWHKGSWQREFAPLPVMEALAEHVGRALDDAPGPLTREELVSAVDGQIDHDGLADRLRSGWSALLKPLAWQGVLCQGPPRGRNVTFARPGRLVPEWPGLPDPDVAGPAVVRDHLAAFGPATPESFDAWLLRGATRRADLRRWFAALGDEIASVDVEGRAALVLRADVDALAATRPRSGTVHLLPGFDQYVLGPGTNDPVVVPVESRGLVSRAGGWISPVVLLDGHVAGTWEPAADGEPQVTPFPGVELPRAALGAAVERMRSLLHA